MLVLKCVLVSAAFELGRSIDEEHPSLAGMRLTLAQYHHARSYTGAVEEVRRQANDSFDEVGFEEVTSDPLLSAAAEECPLRKNDRKSARLCGHRLDHVLDPRVVAGALWRRSGEIAPKAISTP